MVGRKQEWPPLLEASIRDETNSFTAGVLQEDGSATRASRVDGDASGERSVSKVQRTKSEV